MIYENLRLVLIKRFSNIKVIFAIIIFSKITIKKNIVIIVSLLRIDNM